MTTKCEKFYNNIDKITGLSSNSASLSDIWFIRFKNAFHGSHEAVLKLYASEIQFQERKNPEKILRITYTTTNRLLKSISNL